MVQKKVAKKLGIIIANDDVIKAENIRSSSTCCNHPETKTREMKKKMKKSKPIKGSNLNNLLSSKPKELAIIPGEPPPTSKVTTTTPQKQSPNYMKSTSSSHAKKELLIQVSPKNNSQLTNSKVGSNSGKKPAKTLARTSSLKMGGRTLTKSPSFKPARGGGPTKKSSQVVLCENLDVERATCSSTLKDSKFPAYLTLNPGGTELEGTSAIKVCTYTYCSLNGHHHAPSPPLKCFLSAKRRTLKTQKSFKLGCLSPRRAKHAAFGKKEIVDQENCMTTSFDIFFAEREETSGTTGPSNGCDVELIVDEQDENPSAENGVANQNGELSLQSFVDQETKSESMSNWVDELDVEIPATNELLETDSETSDMEWEEGTGSVPYLDDEVDNSTQNNKGFDMEEVHSWEFDSHDFHDERVAKLDDAVSSCFEEIPAEEEVLQEIYDDEIMSDEEWFGDDSSIPVIDIQSHGQVSLATNEETELNAESSFGIPEDTTNAIEKTDEIVEEIVSEEVPSMVQAENTDQGMFFKDDAFDGSVVAKSEDSQVEDNLEEELPSAGDEEEREQLVDAAPTAELVDDEIMNDGECFGDDSSIPVIDIQSHAQAFPTCDAFEELTTIEDSELDAESSYGMAETMKNTTEKNDAFDEDIDNIDEGSFVKEEVVDESVVTKSEDSKAEDSLEKELPSADDEEEMEQLVDAANSLTAELVDDILQNISETSQEMTKNNNSEFGVEMISQVTIANEVDEDEDGNAAEKFNLQSVSASEASEEIEMEKEQNGNQNIEEIEIEMERETKHGAIYKRSNASREVPETSHNLIEIIRCERPVDEMEESKNFNPKEPNYLQLQPDPKGEKVDLKHLDLDERKNAEEWMIDHALQRAVTKLAPARKRKVALLVEAFEAVLPIPKYESRRMNHTNAAFTSGRQIQACN